MKTYSNFNLSMLNLWIGLCRGEAGLPNKIRNLGYKDKWIELEFSISSGETVNPELIISSDRQYHTVLFEWKEGHNAVIDQLKRYSIITSDDLTRQAALSPVETRYHDVCLLGLKENVSKLKLGLDEANCRFPLLAVNNEGISLEFNRFVVNEFTNVFSPELHINMETIPTQLIPFDHNSEYWEIAERIIPQIITYMAKNSVSLFL